MVVSPETTVIRIDKTSDAVVVGDLVGDTPKSLTIAESLISNP